MQHWLSLHFFQDLIQNFLNNSMILPQKLKEMAQKLKFPVVLTNLIYWKIAQTKSLQPAVFPSFFADFSSYTTFSNHPSSPLVTFLPILNHDSIFAQQRQCLFFREKVHQSPIVLPFNPSFFPIGKTPFPYQFWCINFFNILSSTESSHCSRNEKFPNIYWRKYLWILVE